jgi:hypothetical protein
MKTSAECTARPRRPQITFCPAAAPRCDRHDPMHLGVDHRRRYLRMPEQFPHYSDVVAGLTIPANSSVCSCVEASPSQSATRSHGLLRPHTSRGCLRPRKAAKYLLKYRFFPDSSFRYRPESGKINELEPTLAGLTNKSDGMNASIHTI